LNQAQGSFCREKGRFTGSIEACPPATVLASLSSIQQSYWAGKMESLIRIHGSEAPICLVKGTLLG